MPDLEQTIVIPGEKQRFFTRFTAAQRYMHGVLFSSFLGLAATGLPMRFSQSLWARKFASAVGGFGAIIFFHKLCAIVLTIASLAAVTLVPGAVYWLLKDQEHSRPE